MILSFQTIAYHLDKRRASDIFHTAEHLLGADIVKDKVNGVTRRSIDICQVIMKADYDAPRVAADLRQVADKLRIKIC